MDTDEYTLTISPLDTSSADAARQKSIDRIREYKSMQNSIRTGSCSHTFMTDMSQSITIDETAETLTPDSLSIVREIVEKPERPQSDDIIPIVTEEEAIEMRNIIINLSQRLENMEKLQTDLTSNVSKLQKIVVKQATVIKEKDCDLNKYKNENAELLENEKDYKMKISIQREIRKKCAMYASVIRNHEMEIKKIKKENKNLQRQQNEDKESKQKESEIDKENKLKIWKQNKRNQQKAEKLEAIITDMNVEMKTLKNKLIKAENGYNVMVQTNKRDAKKRQKLENELLALQKQYKTDCGQNVQTGNEIMILSNMNNKLKLTLERVRYTLSESVTNEHNMREELHTKLLTIRALEDEVSRMKAAKVPLKITENTHCMHVDSEIKNEAAITAKTEQMLATSKE